MYPCVPFFGIEALSNKAVRKDLADSPAESCRAVMLPGKLFSRC